MTTAGRRREGQGEGTEGGEGSAQASQKGVERREEGEGRWGWAKRRVRMRG